MNKSRADDRARLAVIGDNCLDVYASKGVVTAGGNAINVAAYWSRSGTPLSYYGAVGRDLEGSLLTHILKREVVPTENISLLEGCTGVTILGNDHNDRKFLKEYLGVSKNYAPPPRFWQALTTFAWVHIGTNVDSSTVEVIRRRHRRVSIDVSTRRMTEPLDGIAIVFASAPEGGAERVAEVARDIDNAGARIGVITCGGKGAYVSYHKTLVYAPAPPGRIIDTCGAGDSFIAEFVRAYTICEMPLEECLVRATRAGTAACSYLGGFRQQPVVVPPWLLRKYALQE